MAGAFWATSALSIALGGGAQTPPPCGPDGHCAPSTATFGTHPTRWRPFPGDNIGIKPPTPPTKAAEEEDTGGPKLPGPTEEGQLGPARAPRGGGNAPGAEPAEAGAEDAAAAGLGGLPGEVPLPGLELPGIGQPAPPEGGEAPADGPGVGPGQPAAEPGADPLDPFGSTPPAPPAWLKNATPNNQSAAAAELAPLPVVTRADAQVESAPNRSPADPAAFVAPVAAEPRVMDGPNLHSDDAPPMLPPALQGGISSVAPARRLVPPQAVATPALPPLAKTKSVETTVDEEVIVASAEEPVGIQLVNPAEALVDPEAQGLQQAIYFEASDQ
jgi:2-oxoglutarate dehydrogenase E2 component (dihydrolipoamide succinyltransferase)